MKHLPAILRGSVALTLILIVSTASAQQPSSGSLRGEVLDSLGGLIVGATVRTLAVSGVEKTTRTNREGAFQITGLASGKYAVRVAARGFTLSENADVEIAGGRPVVRRIKLSVAVEQQG